MRGKKQENEEVFFNIKGLNIPPDSERRETFEVLTPLKGVLKRVPAFFLFTGVSALQIVSKSTLISCFFTRKSYGLKVLIPLR